MSPRRAISGSNFEESVIHVSAVKRLQGDGEGEERRFEARTRRTRRPSSRRRGRGMEEKEIGRTADGRRTKALLFSYVYEQRGRPSLVEPKIKGEDIERRRTDGRKEEKHR